MNKTVIFISFIFLLSFASAISYNVDIYDGSALVEIDFEDVYNLEFELPYDARVFETNVDNYELIDFEEYKLLRVNRADDLKISYITNSIIDETSSRSFFIFKNNFDEKLDVSLIIPEGAILGDLIIPDANEIITDGKRIILKWNDFSEEEIVVDYNFIKERNDFWICVFIILLIAFILFYLYKSRKLKKQIKKYKQKNKTVRKKTRERRKKDYTRNLFGEEKKIIEYLLNKKGNESWTKELARELEISKVRLSRRLRSLEQKQLIEKIPYGNENRIKLLK